MTRLLLDPDVDLPDEGAGPVTLAATLLDPDPVSVVRFTVNDATTVIQLTASTPTTGWRLTVRRPQATTNRWGQPTIDPGPIVAERTVQVPATTTATWASLIDVDPATWTPTGGSGGAVDLSSAVTAAISRAVTALLGGAGPAYDTLGELQSALMADESAAATLTGLVGTKLTQAQVDARIVAGTALVGRTGAYADLSGKPTIPSTTGLAPLASPTFTGAPTIDGVAVAKVTDIGIGTGAATPSAPGYDVVLLAGQSNMVGNGGDATTALIDITDPDVWVYAPGGTNAGVAVQAADPLIHHSGTAANVGPGMEFARWYRTMYPTRRVLLVPAAHNGTAILSGSPRWDATTGWPNDANNLYNLAIAQTQAALAAAGANSKLAAILWIQGESDSGQSTAAYRTGLEYVIDGFRSRLSAPNVPFILGSMTPAWVAGNGGAPAIDAAHVSIPTRKAYTAFVRGPAGQVTADTLHYTAPAARTIGRAMAAAYLTALANTAPASAVAANPPAPPTVALISSAAPVVTGTAAVGSVLTTTNGTWSATPDSFSYQWNRAGAAITGATASTYTLASADTGQAVTCAVTATKAGYASGAATSNAITVPAAGGTTITDSFTRADSTTSLGTTEAGGKTWAVTGGPWGIASNQAYNAGGANNAIAVFDIGATDHTVQAKVNVQDSGTMILLRYVDGNNFAGVFASGGTMIPYTKTAGANGFPGSSTTCLAGDTLKATVVGSTITYSRNGTQVGTFTTALTGTKVGIRADTNAARIDDFLASAP